MSKVKKKLRDQLDRDDYWMGMAFLVAAGSKNYTRQQGAVLVGSNSEALSLACDGLPRATDGDHSPHAEINSLLAARTSVHGGILYVTHTPCYHCVLAIAAAGLKRVVYFPTRKLDDNSADALRAAYVQFEEFPGNLNWMRDYMKTLDALEIFDGQSDK